MANCSLLKAKPDKFRKKKPLCAIQDEASGFEEYSDSEEAMLYFMAMEEKN